VNGVDISAEATPANSLHNWGVAKTISFPGHVCKLCNLYLVCCCDLMCAEEENMVMAIAAHDDNSCPDGGCENTGGVMFGCRSSDPDSAWNNVYVRISCFDY
jgi:hypothetical protein